MKKALKIILLLSVLSVFSQDTLHFNNLSKKARANLFNNPDSSKLYAYQQFKYAQEYNGDSWVAEALNNIGNYYYVTNHLDSALKFYGRILNVTGTEGDYLRMGSTHNNLGNVYKSKTDYVKAFEHYSLSMENYKKLNDESRLFSIYSNIGILLDEKGDYPRALENYYIALRIAEKNNDEEKKASAYNNIAIVYKLQGDYEKALDYNFKSLELRKKLNLDFHVITSLNNIANIYKMQDKYDDAIKFYNDALELSNSFQDTFSISMLQNNIGSIFMMKKDYEKAYSYYKSSLDNKQFVDDVIGTVEVMRNIGAYYGKQKDYKNAIEWCKKSYGKAQDYELIAQQEDACKCLYTHYKNIGDNDNAIKYLEEQYRLKDSLFNDEKNEEILEQEFNYKLDKKTYEDSLTNAAKQQVLQAKIEKEENQIMMLYFGIGLVVIFSGFVYNRFKIAKKQKEIIAVTNEELNQTNEELAAQRDEIESQKNKIEHAHQEIRDSIDYAKRIQEAILPSLDLMNKNLKNGFVFYQPKDVVAGDFYWCEKVDNKIYVAAADCTGHGVPGAMVSVVCSNALTKVLLEDGIKEVDQILNKTRDIVLEKLAKSSEVKDGMDISLACFDFVNMKLEWAGANNPLYIFKEGKIQITKGDKEPVGYTENPTPFTKHNFDLAERDEIFLFTDGYADQFGGEKGKKLGYKNFREKLVEISSLEMDKQKEELEFYFKHWKGHEEQVDDVCVIGIRI